MSNTKTRPIACGGAYLLLSKTIKNTTTYRYTPTRCNRWDCEHCRSIKSAAVVKLIKEKLTGQTLYFVTITCKRDESVTSSWENFGKRWNRLRLKITRKVGKFSYIRVLEPHKNPCYPHMHMLVTKPIPLRWLKSACIQSGFGWCADIKPVTSGGAVGYISKYLTKTWPSMEAMRIREQTRCRIVQCSQDLGAIFKTESEWQLVEKYKTKLEMLNTAKKHMKQLSIKYQFGVEVACGSYGTDFTVGKMAKERESDPLFTPFANETDRLLHYAQQYRRMMERAFSVWTLKFAVLGNCQNPEHEPNIPTQGMQNSPEALGGTELLPIPTVPDEAPITLVNLDTGEIVAWMGKSLRH